MACLFAQGTAGRNRSRLLLQSPELRGKKEVALLLESHRAPLVRLGVARLDWKDPSRVDRTRRVSPFYQSLLLSLVAQHHAVKKRRRESPTYAAPTAPPRLGGCRHADVTYAIAD